MVESQLPRGVGKESSRVQMPGLRAADFDLDQECPVASVTQKQQNSVQLIFKDSIL